MYDFDVGYQEEYSSPQIKLVAFNIDSNFLAGGVLCDLAKTAYLIFSSSDGQKKFDLLWQFCFYVIL